MISAILAAPTWARLGISVRDERMRERAADELARSIETALRGDADRHNDDQLSLAI